MPDVFAEWDRHCQAMKEKVGAKSVRISLFGATAFLVVEFENGGYAVPIPDDLRDDEIIRGDPNSNHRPAGVINA